MKLYLAELPRSSFQNKIVYVRCYQRFRYGMWETVRSHFRRWPERYRAH